MLILHHGRLATCETERAAMAKFESILATIGNTPVVALNHLSPAGFRLWAKLEAANPMGSVKDRIARAMIEHAEHTGELVPGQTVVEATSGNTGIALAMVCAQKGYPLVVVMAENFSVERRRLMRFLGARVVLTPAAEKGSGMLAKAEELAHTHGWFLCRQFDNPVNAKAHAETTAREILADFADTGLDAWVTGAGTGGTLLGVARELRRHSPGTRIIVCEPDNSPVLTSGEPMPRANGAPPSHPRFRPHLMQGWSPDFIPSLTRQALSEGLVDRVMAVNGEDALAVARRLASQEGILAGISGGATVAGALGAMAELPAGTQVLCMLPDTGERYLSTPLFAPIEAEMDEAEIAISCSTPRFRFDRPNPSGPSLTPSPDSGATTMTMDTQMRELVADVIEDHAAPVVMFALEWCEFCWSVRRLFEMLQIPCRILSLDAVEFQLEERGSRIRAVLHALTGSPTIPQVFIGGRLVGGCTDVFEAYQDGSLQEALKGVGMSPRATKTIDPHTLLPTWLHSR